MMKKARIPVLALVLSIAFILGTALSVGAFQFGTPDGGNHPYVVMCVFDGEGVGPMWRASGFLISPTVVFTAGNATDGASGGRVTNSESIPPYTGNPTDYPFPGPWAVEASEIYTHPDHRIGLGPGNGLPQFDSYDVGIVILSEPIVLPEYAALPDPYVVDTLSNMADVDLVGYGVNEQQMGGGPPYWTWERMRCYAPAKVVPSQDCMSDMFVKLTANPGGGKGGATFGDSGGPILLAGTSIVIANNSFVTNYNCSGVGYAQRVDIPEVLDWINETID